MAQNFTTTYKNIFNGYATVYAKKAVQVITFQTIDKMFTSLHKATLCFVSWVRFIKFLSATDHYKKTAIETILVTQYLNEHISVPAATM